MQVAVPPIISHPRQMTRRVRQGLLSSLLLATLGAHAASGIEAAAPDDSPREGMQTVTVTGKHEATTEHSHALGGRTVSLFKGEQVLRDIPQPVTVITRQLLDERKLLDLHDVLQNTPGVQVDYTDSERVSYNSRGFAIDALQVDGLTMVQAGSAFAQPDTAVLDRVEVLRGAGGMLRGAGNPSATVNMVRKRPTRDFQASAGLTVGSWERRRVEADVSAPLNAAGTVRGRLVAVKDKKGFFQDAKKEDREVVYGVVQAELGPRTSVTGILQRTDLDATGAWGGMPGALDGSALNLPLHTYLGAAWNRWNRYNDQAQLDLEHRFGNEWTLKLSAGYTALRLKENGFKQSYFARPAGATDPYLMTVTTAQYTGNDSRQQAVNLVADGPFMLLGRRHQLLAGLERLRNRSADSWGAGNLYPQTVDIRSWNPWTTYPERQVNMPSTRTMPVTTTQNAAFASLRLSLAAPLTAIVGGRLNWYDYASLASPAGDFKVRRELTPYAGLVLDLSQELSAYASFTEIFTPQNVRGADGAILAPITGKDYELGLKGELGGLQGSVGLFRIDNDGRAIEDVGSRNPCLPYFTSGYCRIAGGKQRSEGWEAELAGELLPGWQLMAGYTNTRTRYLVDSAANLGQPLRSIDPKHQLRLYTSYSTERSGPGWTVGGGVQLQSDAYVRSGTLRVDQGSYAVANAMASYRFSDKLELQLNVNNLFDRVYYKKFGATGIPYYYGDPRNLALSLRASL